MKKILSLVLVLSLVLGSFGMAFAAPADVVGTDYESAVERLTALGIITGYEDGSFKPNNTITRAEYAAIVVRTLGLENAAKISKGTTKFTDVPADHWAAGYINVASSQGIINGMGDGTFAPSANVTFEQAVTMVVRALGYEPAAKAKGGYPTGYLVVAAQEDITDDVKGVAGMAAVRGIVAQIVDNSLEVAMMIQSGYGDEAKFVKSGTEGTEVETILVDKLDVKKVKEIVENVPRTDSDLEDNEIELATTGVVEVLSGFDFEGAFGAEITAYLNDDDVVVSYEVEDDVILDAATWDADDEELNLVAEDEGYEFAADAVVYVDGEAADVEDAEADFDYVKVILNDDDEIIFIDAFNWDNSIIVEEVDDNVITGTNEDAADDELDVEDYTIVKAGKVITADDIKEGDVLYFNDDAEYAEVYAEVVKGELKEDNVFDDEFELNKETYDITGKATYVNEDGDMTVLDVAALEDMADADDNTITVTLNRAGDVRFVAGDIEVTEDETVAGFLTEDMTVYSSRNKLYVAIDMVNENGAEVAYDVQLDADLLGLTDAEFAALDLEDADVLETAGKVIEVTIDEDGDVTEIAYDLTTTDFDADGVEDDMVELDDKYIAGKRLSSSVVVFYTEDYTDDADDIVVTTWANVEDFELVDVAEVYYGTDNYVDYLVVSGSDAEVDTTDKDVLVTEIKALSSGDAWRIKGFVNGEAVTLYTDSDEITEAATIAGAVYGDLLTVSVDDKTGKVVADADEATAINGTITAINYGDKEVTFGTGDDAVTYELVSDGYVYDATDADDVTVAKLRDLHVGDTVSIYLDVDGTVFAKHIVLFTEAE